MEKGVEKLLWGWKVLFIFAQNYSVANAGSPQGLRSVQNNDFVTV